MEEKKKISEIDFIHLATIVLKQKMFLLRFAIAGLIVGVVVALSIPKTFSASVSLAPEFTSGTFGLSNSISDLASSFGINLDGNKGSMDALYPELYPDIFESTDFVSSLYDVPVRLQDDPSERSYLVHLRKDTRLAWWNYPKVWIAQLQKPKEKQVGSVKGKVDPYAMSRTQWEIYDAVNSSITCFVDKKTSVITISVLDQDPMVAAILADTLQLRLQEYIINYRTSKARNDLIYYQKIVSKAKGAYEQVRRQYVALSDANIDASLKVVTSKIEDLENDMQLKYNVYSQSLAQLKMAEARLQERTPAFTIIQPAKVNSKAVSTPRIVIVFIWICLAIAAGMVYVLYKEYKKKEK